MFLFFRNSSLPRYGGTGPGVPHGIKIEDFPRSYARPSILKEDDINAMNDDPDDSGWAGAQEEIDYSVKLNFEGLSIDKKNGKGDKEQTGTLLTMETQQREERTRYNDESKTQVWYHCKDYWHSEMCRILFFF